MPMTEVEGHEFSLGKSESQVSSWVFCRSLENVSHTLPLKHISNPNASPCIHLVQRPISHLGNQQEPPNSCYCPFSVAAAVNFLKHDLAGSCPSFVEISISAQTSAYRDLHNVAPLTFVHSAMARVPQTYQYLSHSRASAPTVPSGLLSLTSCRSDCVSASRTASESAPHTSTPAQCCFAIFSF